MSCVSIDNTSKNELYLLSVRALGNLDKSRKEACRKLIIKYVSNRRMKQSIRNASFLCKIGLRKKDMFPDDKMSSFFVDLYMGHYEDDKIDDSYFIPVFYDMDNAPDWWAEDDFLLMCDIRFEMIRTIAWDKKIRDFMVAMKYGDVSSNSELISYIYEWSK